MIARSLVATLCGFVVLLSGNGRADASNGTHADGSPTKTTPAAACGAPLPIDQLIEQFVSSWLPANRNSKAIVVEDPSRVLHGAHIGLPCNG